METFKQPHFVNKITLQTPFKIERAKVASNAKSRLRFSHSFEQLNSFKEQSTNNNIQYPYFNLTYAKLAKSRSMAKHRINFASTEYVRTPTGLIKKTSSRKSQLIPYAENASILQLRKRRYWAHTKSYKYGWNSEIVHNLISCKKFTNNAKQANHCLEAHKLGNSPKLKCMKKINLDLVSNSNVQQEANIELLKTPMLIHISIRKKFF
eukprot:TRINITY_DN13102_c0_g1_i3.p1 TRINITY_DN13102_c0_g1~~TRINITY_DN13102_c0_g1_i3.p1  ORF type:complete len:208 (-),score=18.83 TRINITY_DN13102_c0_g1_i3:135-758(-)